MTLSGVGDLLGVAALRGDNEHALSGTSGGCVTAAILTGVDDCRSENTESGEGKNKRIRKFKHR